MTEVVGGEPLPQPMRRLNYVGNGNELDAVRGLAIFDEVARHLPEIVRVGTSLRLETDRCGLYVVRLPVNAGTVEALETVATKPCGCRVIVDVCVDLWSENASITGDARWWRTVARPQLERAMRCASLVTVPVPDLVDAVMRFNERVAVVPDCPNGEVTEAALTGWMEAQLLAVSHRREGTRP